MDSLLFGIHADVVAEALGYVVTAAAVAGGSKGSLKLFRDFLGWKSTAHEGSRGRDQGAPVTRAGSAAGASLRAPWLR